MLWADRIAGEIRDTRTPRNGKIFRIRDEKTLSGRVHVGSMRGVALMGKKKGDVFTFEIPSGKQMYTIEKKWRKK